jgi:hypothetical protein
MIKQSLFYFSILVVNYCHSQSYDQEIKKAERAFGKTLFDSCIFYFDKAFLLEKPKGADLYNAAVCNTMNGNSKQAFILLENAIHADINISKLKIDPDLDPLHQQPGWKRLIRKSNKVQQKEFKKTLFPADAKKLAQLWETDQYYRFRLGAAYEKKDTATVNEIWKKLKPEDAANLKQLEAIMNRIGWPTATKVGKRGANTAFLIIDHSPREIMEKYFPLLESAAKKGEASLSDYAVMQDRILVNRGKKQIYGTQKYWDEKQNKFVFFPIEDEKNVNARRKEVGLDPLPEFKQ